MELSRSELETLHSRIAAQLADPQLPDTLRELLVDVDRALASQSEGLEKLRIVFWNQEDTRSSYEDAYFNLLARS